MSRPALESALMPNTYLKLMAQSARDPARLMANSGVDLDDLLLREAPITVAQQLQCARNAAAVIRRPDWHFDWAESIGAHFHGPLTSALFSTPTLGDGLSAFVRYIPARIPYLGWRQQLAGGWIRIEVRPLMDLGDLEPVLTEIPLLGLLAYVRTLRGGRLQGVRLEFAHAPRVAAVRYSKRFRGEFHFNSRADALLVPAAWRVQAHAGHDPILWRTSLRRCDLAERLGHQGAVVDTLRQWLMTAFDQVDGVGVAPSINDAARRLHLSVRTLHRRLAEAGYRYQRLVDEARRERAGELLAERGRKLADIATALGYRDPANFSRAFRRWHGVPPREAR